MTDRIPFSLDRREKKLLGVCSGLGRTLNIDPTFIRVGFIAVPFLTFVTFWQAFIAYLALGAIGFFAAGKLRRRRGSELDRMDYDTGRRHSIRDLRENLDTNDRRMMAIDHHLNSRSSDDLAREIEALRHEKSEDRK
ncbi:PspC domain-containing protein [Sphingomonas ginkgonis]|uniref:PspC domain-containing protein n=1 Tax=Sphingomonas ginkgonis TaxID=2315330 RepID=A0A3R9X920_9SPHN|nr:PspC domain-containing protein [Sphingomonas ginkgonis]RST31622.1 PspC domain-containing protein [Sphingomonas ginkgonis]